MYVDGLTPTAGGRERCFVFSVTEHKGVVELGRGTVAARSRGENTCPRSLQTCRLAGRSVCCGSS